MTCARSASEGTPLHGVVELRGAEPKRKKRRMPLLAAAASRTSAVDHHGNLAVGEHLLRFAAEQQSRDAAATV